MDSRDDWSDMRDDPSRRGSEADCGHRTSSDGIPQPTAQDQEDLGGGQVRRLASSEVYRNAWMRVREDRVLYADGSAGVYGVVEKPDYALVLPRQADGFYLVEQYRYPVSGRYWEFPQGSWPDDGGQWSAELLARAELREETGLVARSLRLLGRVHVAYGYATQACHVFLADDLTAGVPMRERTETDMRQRWVSLREIDEMVLDGRLVDSASLAALALFDRQARLPGAGRARQ
ncbi:NUDIX hydrolase [Micromonospora arborensis]|uniref:NUDIX hydrolase n=1 Tax=Micromonospora arborensis TaxID=2116518 RepID=UPI00343E1A66